MRKMEDPHHPLIRLPKADSGRACEMLSRAFFHDAKMAHLMPEIAARKDRSRHLFEFELRYGMIYGDVYTTSPAVEGVAVWLPSDKSEVTLWRAFRAGGMGLQRHLGKESMDRLMAFSTAIDDLHKKHLPSPHCYLFFIGVDPSFQGKGYAGRLLRPVLDRLDKQKIPCYLNTQNEKNIGLYEHFGFRVIDQLTLPNTPILHTAMKRNPFEAT
jgi:ribosomal protein S18 acetylase RimI-like enzyme